MMRSMYSAVSGLKTHQTKMDIIGNNIANVNTVGFKSSSVVFSDILYQTTSNASGANAATGIGGVNAKQIGLGVSAAATKVNITSAGASETTGNPFDIRLSDKNSTNFFVVNNGSENIFTRSGSFYVDGVGNLCMSSTGYTVMGWQVDPTTGDIKQDTVSALRIMQEANLTSAPESTTKATISGVLDENDSEVSPSGSGKTLNLNFYDSLGYSYTAKFAVRINDPDVKGAYNVELTSILDSNGNDLLEGMTSTQIGEIFGSGPTTSTVNTYGLVSGYTYNGTQFTYTDPTSGAVTTYNATANPGEFADAAGNTITLEDIFGVSSAEMANMTENPTDYTYRFAQDADGNYQCILERTYASHPLEFDTSNGKFKSVGSGSNGSVYLNLSNLSNGTLVDASRPYATNNGNFENIDVDFTQCLNYDNKKKSTISAAAGATDGSTGKGRRVGAMTGITIDTNGKIYGTYDNGNTELLGQIAVAQFSNASGLEKVGESCYRTTLNSGDFDGIGVDITADGSSMTTGELEMSNVDLSTEFTSMITTQRGFQANSRVISTSDSLLEELVNLKR